MAEEKIYVLGIGDDGLSGLGARSRDALARADLVIGSEPWMQQAQEFRDSLDLKSEWMAFGADLARVIGRIRESKGKRIVVLATGDPLFYGTARYLCDALGKERFEVIPHVSSMQLAFARVKESWDDAYLVDLSSRPLDEVLEKIRIAGKAGLFTTAQTPPNEVAKRLVARGLDYYFAYVCENLGSPDERVTTGDIADIAKQSFGPLNIMILVRKPGVPDRPVERLGMRMFGNPDDAFLQAKPKSGLLTPHEIRSVALAQLDLGPASVVWDVGAGSGSVAIEAALIAREGTAYAIEMDPEDHGLIRENADRFGAMNVVPALGAAPQAWATLPDPDAIFLAGSMKEIVHLVEAGFARLKPGGRFVVNVGSIESLSGVQQTMKKAAGACDVWMINIARGVEQFDRVRFEAVAPSFLLKAVKPA
ncbi:MAG TPA: precorrin-6y C5,15-methyltransferase (decarboxylating) subunit CbiE [Pirellulaceae bacterium]|jgi:precorrin-6Y C5,15-methyltransferase (decarboxylating)|nr:precorrin-6y C5,15-methyltransferase (decarboxylating) subunit CbiE [Pirellulaceae bacterium]